MISRIERFVIALVFALCAAGITLMVVSAQDETPPSVTQGDDSSRCVGCHKDFQAAWLSGAHGQSGTDPVFLDQWTSQGKPGACLVCHTTGYDPATATYQADGVTCEACHPNVPADHPKSPAPVDRSPDLCGRCHSDTRFDWQDWQISAHYQRGMECVTCHDPHTAALKKVPGPNGEMTDDISQLCINCHKETSMDFSYTTHHAAGLSCVDCHVNHLEKQSQNVHALPDHSFNASLASCNTCHALQMHSAADASAPVTANSATTTESGTPEVQMQLASVTPQPTPVSPIGFSILAGLIGLAGGMVMAPWLERWYKHATKHDTDHNQEDDHD